MFVTRNLNLRKLNSLTKYPSILTYHKIDPKNGTLYEEIIVPLTGELIGTEKVDGSNVRILVLPDLMYIIASREDLLYARGDLIGNDEMGIVTATKLLAEQLVMKYAELVVNKPLVMLPIYVFYLKIFGGNIGGSGKAFRHYSTKKEHGHRMFDLIQFDQEQFLQLMEWPLEKFSGWRERGGQPYVSEKELQYFSEKFLIPLTPRIPLVPLPIGIDDTLAYLGNSLAKSQCILDDVATGKPEGLVVRTADRSLIAKLRFEDYERTVRKRQPNKITY